MTGNRLCDLCAALLRIWVDILDSANCDVTEGRADTNTVCTFMTGRLSDGAMQSHCTLIVIMPTSVQDHSPPPSNAPSQASFSCGGSTILQMTDG